MAPSTDRPTAGAADGSHARAPLARGAIAGVAGATVLALWFLVVDTLEGRPLYTPAFLARVLLGADAGPALGPIALYTVVHYAAFVVVGMGVARLRARAVVVPTLLLGATLGFLLFDVMFYGSIWLTGVDVVADIGWPEVLAGNALAGVGLVGVVNALSPGPTTSWAGTLVRHETVREGLVAGLIGAGAVAAWFLILDGLAGRLLFTPAALGSVLFHGASSTAGVDVSAVTVLAYTGLHVGAFVVVGLVAAGIAAFAEDRHAYVLLGAILLVVTFETFFVGVLTIVAQWLLEVIAWWSIAVANLVAGAAMGLYLWRRHPGLARALGELELERDVEADRAPEPATPPVAGTTGGGSDTP